MKLSTFNLIPLTVRPQDAKSIRFIKAAVLNRQRSLPHIERKFYHFTMGVICFSLYAFFLTREQAIFTLISVGGSWILADVLRLYSSPLNQMALKYFGKVMRREELKSISGNSFYILGMLFSVLFFPKPIVLLSVLFLAVGDPVAAVVGSLYGKTKIIGKKSFEGALANYIASFLMVTLVSYFYFQYPIPKTILLAFVGATISVVAELAPLPIDDNFSIPALSSLLLLFVHVFLFSI